MTLVPALFVWRWPDLESLLWMAALAVFGTLGHMCIARAYTFSETSGVGAFDFTQLIAVALIGYFVFAETPDVWTWIAATLISASAIYIARREARLRGMRAVAVGSSDAWPNA
jgi:drug/metabolite transporter (DMT)-like permease